MSETLSLGQQLAALSPLLILIASALVMLLVDAFASRREPGFLRSLTLLCVLAAGLAGARQLGRESLDLGHFVLAKALIVDHLALTCDLVALVALAGVVGLARERGRTHESSREAFGERAALLLLAGVGALICIHAGDLFVLWLGVELLSVSALLTMFAHHDAVADLSRRRALSLQLVPGAVVSCLMLLGIVLIYAALGSTSLDGFSQEVTRLFARWGGVQRWVRVLAQHGAEIAQTDPGMIPQARAEIARGLAPAALFLPGVLLLLVGLLTKLGMLPFARRRELAESAPLHVSALWSTVAVVALVAALLRVYVGAMHSPRLVNEPYGWTGALPTIALLTGTWASLASTRQRRLSRVVAQLSLAQLSLVLLGVVAAASFHGHLGVGGRHIAPEFEVEWTRVTGDAAYAATLVALVAHVLASVGCFAAIGASRGFRGPEVRMQHWAGMAARRPSLAFSFTLCLLSLVGLPPLAGFVGKLGLLRALAEHSAMRWMVVLVVLQLAVCAFVALRVVAAMYFGDETVSEPGERAEPSPWPARTAAAAALLLVALGFGGQALVDFCRRPAAVGSFAPGDDDRLEWLEDSRARWQLERERADAAERLVEADAGIDAERQQSVVREADGAAEGEGALDEPPAARP